MLALSLPSRLVERFAGRLRFPALFLVTAALFVVDLAIPDVIPFVDEVLLGLGTVLLGSWKKRRSVERADGSHDRIDGAS